MVTRFDFGILIHFQRKTTKTDFCIQFRLTFRNFFQNEHATKNRPETRKSLNVDPREARNQKRHSFLLTTENPKIANFIFWPATRKLDEIKELGKKGTYRPIGWHRDDQPISRSWKASSLKLSSFPPTLSSFVLGLGS